MQCAAHPDVETELRCGKCETPICPRCLVYTPVGARCRTCARLRRPPMYEVKAGTVVRAVPVALVLGAIVGVIWGLVLPRGLLGLFALFIAFIVGPPIGYLFAAALDRVTNRKRGAVMQAIAVVGVVLAWLIHGIIGGALLTDLFGIILVIAAAIGAGGRLR